LTRTRRGSRWFAALFSFAVFVGIGIIIERLGGTGAAILAVSAAVLLRYGWQRVAVFDAVLLMGLAGVSLELGAALQPAAAVAILAILSVYDIFAVYVTGHMVTAAEALLRQKALFAIIIPVAPVGFLARLSSARPGADFLYLGTGDLVLPAMLVASAGRGGLIQALIVAVGALAGLAGTHLIFTRQKQRRPIPALPPIALGAIIGYLAAFIAA
jgi:presenilin-like A22 family membrane protease